MRLFAGRLRVSVADIEDPRGAELRRMSGEDACLGREQAAEPAKAGCPGLRS